MMNIRSFSVIFLLVSKLLTPQIHAQTTWFVDGTNGSNISSGRGGWQNAKKDLQEVIQAAGEGDRIWVTEGTYFPTAIPDSVKNLAKSLTARDRAFHIPKYLEIFGGFKGNETELTQRDWLVHPSILSGDIGVSGSNEDNVYHVVIISGVKTARLDGFTVIGGNADGNSAVPLKVSGIQNGFVKKYDVYDDKGGGLHIINSPTNLENFEVRNCSSDDKGGGIFITQSPSTLRNVTIIQNRSEDAEGGGLYLERTNNTITQCVIADNYAYKGGGLYALADTLKLTNSIILNNEAEVSGAGIFSGAYSGININGCTIYGNKIASSGKGAGIYLTQTDSKILNTIIQQNTIRGITTSTGCDIDSLFLGGKLSIDYTFTQKVWNGTQNSIEPVAYFNTSNAIGADNIWKTGDDGFIPTPNSLVIGKGIASSEISQDITGLQRDNGVDIGAYQYNPCEIYNRVLYVNAHNEAIIQDGSSWTTAFSRLQDALDIINTGCGSRVKEIWVAAGTYIPDRYPSIDSSSPSGKAFSLLKDVRLMGGFKGDETNTASRDFIQNKTILSGQLNESTQANNVLIVSGLGVNAFISGFYIQNGDATQEDKLINIAQRNIHTSKGAGIYCDFSFANFEDLFVEQNKAINGAGIYIFQGKPVFRNITLRDNQAINLGGGILAETTDAAFSSLNASNNKAKNGAALATENCGFATFNRIILENNSATGNGGGYYGFAGTARISQAVFLKNSAGNGAGIFADQAHRPLVENALFLENTAFIGGASAQFNGFIEFTNCNFIGNLATEKAGAVYGQNFGNVNIVNCIFQNNALNGQSNLPASDVFLESNVGNLLDHSLFQTTKPGNNNISGNPGFYKPNNYLGSDGKWFTEDDGMMLLKISPCVNAGNPTIKTGRDITDRPTRAGTDIGAYLSYCGAQNDSILFVDASNKSELQDGKTWATAYSNLQRALNATLYECTNVKEVWVKEGYYYPTIIPDSLLNEQLGVIMTPRYRSFVLYDNLQIYGGFNGSETSINDRNIASHPSVLSGELGIPGVTTDNALHILTLSPGRTIKGSTIIDGFTFSDAKADANSLHYLQNNSIIINDSSGAAIYAVSAGAIIRNCIFRNLQAHTGAAIYAGRNTLEVNHCTFENNIAENGGAIALWNQNISNFKNLFFIGNRANNGGAFHQFNSSYILETSVFEKNIAVKGGAIYQELGNGLQWKNVIFKDNQAQKGAAVYDISTRTQCSNGLFIQNEAADTAGAIYLNGTQLNIFNATFYQNSAKKNAGAIYQKSNPFNLKLQLFNNIFYQNAVAEDLEAEDADISIDKENFYATHTTSNSFGCDTCFTGNPLFLAPESPKGFDDIFFTPDDGFALQFNSPFLNKAQWATTPSKDMSGYDKGIHFADLGPYKTSPCITHQYTERLYVKAVQNSSIQDGKSWETAYSDLQKALDVANAACVNIQEIWVAQGIYTPNHFPDSLFNAITGRITSPTQKAFFLTEKVSIYGGFEGNETILTDRNPNLYSSELHGLYQGAADTTKKTSHVFIISGVENVLLDGFKFRYSASQSGSINVNGYNINNFNGGGIHITHANTTLKNNHLYNLSSTRGGSIYAIKSQLFGENNLFETNAANFEGGAAYMDSSSMFSKNNRFTNNAMTVGSSSLSGGALYLRHSQLNSFGDVWEDNKANVGGAISADFSSTGILSNGVFYQNTAGSGGAIIQRGDALLQLENLLFIRNSAQLGGAIYAEKTFAINAATFYGNSSRDVGGAIHTPNGVDNQLKLQNVLFAENTSPNGGSDFYRGNGNNHNIEFCFLQEDFLGTGNIKGIHRFRDTANFRGPDGLWMTHDDGLNLAISSDAINRGNTNAPANDIAGYPRRAVADIGAYEFSICNDYESVEKLFVNVANTHFPQDGLSWATAFSQLQDAINLTDFPCVSANEIWLAQGTYHPEYIPDEFANLAAGNELNNRRKTYWINKKGLQLLGGFAEGDTSKIQRNPTLKATIIDGDIGTIGDPSDNSIHLLVLDSKADSTVIDGIQFRNVYANTNGEFIISGKKVSDRNGAIVARNIHLNINNALLNENYAKTGASIFASDANLSLNKVTFSNNNADQGAGIALSNTPLQLIETFFGNNNSTISGGAIYSSNKSSISLSNGNFQSNKSLQGGSIDVVDQGSLSITNSTFDADSARNGASIHLSNGTTISIESSVLKNSINGNGAIRADGATMIINALQMSGHTSYENGAALNIFGNSSIKISNSYFNNNKSSGNGGALYIDAPSSSSFIKECKFADNQANISGGAIKINNRQLDFIFKDNTFSGNSALQAGGAVSVENGVLYFTKSTFENNIATYGGAIQVLNAFAQHQFNNCTFTGNEAKKAGGAIFINASLFYMNSESVVFEKNLAENGAAFYASPGGRSVTYSCVFFGNRATKSGAGIYFPQKFADASVFNSLFIENEAEELGAGIYVEKESALNAIHNTYYKNNARINGGGHYHEENVRGLAFNNIFLLNTVNGDTNVERTRKNIFLSSQNGFGVDYNVMDTCWVQIGFAGCDRSVETGFFDEEDYKGDDGIWMTGDDGLIPAEMNTIKGLGVASLSNVVAPDRDILGASRVSGHDPGAYNVKTLSTSITNTEKWEISAYPNPFTNVVQVNFGQKTEEDVWVQLFDLQGKNIFNKRIQVSGHLLSITLSPNLSSGMYILQLQTKNKQATISLLKN